MRIKLVLHCANDDIAECLVRGAQEPALWSLADAHILSRQAPEQPGNRIVSVPRPKGEYANIGVNHGG
jgi:hypothetical protein